MDSVNRKLQSLYQQKSSLSYNPYKINRFGRINDQFKDFSFPTNPKKLNHDRKEK